MALAIAKQTQLVSIITNNKTSCWYINATATINKQNSLRVDSTFENNCIFRICLYFFHSLFLFFTLFCDSWKFIFFFVERIGNHVVVVVAELKWLFSHVSIKMKCLLVVVILVVFCFCLFDFESNKQKQRPNPTREETIHGCSALMEKKNTHD